MRTEEQKKQADAQRDKVAGLLPIIHAEVSKAGILLPRTNPKGNVYFSTGMINYKPERITWTGADGLAYSGMLSGQFNINVIGVQLVGKTQERAAATVERAIENMSEADKRQLAEKLMASF